MFIACNRKAFSVVVLFMKLQLRSFAARYPGARYFSSFADLRPSQRFQEEKILGIFKLGIRKHSGKPSGDQAQIF